MSWYSNPTTCLKLDNKCHLSMSTPLNVISAMVLSPLWSHCPPTLHRVARNMAGTNTPSMKNFLRDVSCCDSRVAMTCLFRVLCRQPMKHSAMKSCASLAQKHERQTHADVCANASSLTQHSTQDQNIADGGSSEWRQMHCNVGACKVRFVSPL